MRLLIDKVQAIKATEKYAIWGRFLPDKNEVNLYNEILDAQKMMENSNSALFVSEDNLVLKGAELSSIGTLRKLFRRNFDIVTRVEFSKTCEYIPVECESIVKASVK